MTLITALQPKRRDNAAILLLEFSGLGYATPSSPSIPPIPSQIAEQSAAQLLGDKNARLRARDFKQIQRLLETEVPQLNRVERRTIEGRFFVYQGEYKKAIDSFEKAAELGGESISLDIEIAYAYLYNGDPLSASKIANHVVRAKSLSPDLLASGHLLMGRIRAAEGLLAKAENSMTEALRLFESCPNPDARILASTRSDLGQIFSEQGRFADAATQLNMALSIRSDLASNELELSATYNDLGLLLARQEKYAGAEKYYRKAIDLLRAKFGENHPELAMEWNNLGSLSFRRLRYDEALMYHTMALNIWVEYLGPQHIDVARSYINIGAVLQRKGDLHGARQEYLAAARIFEKREYADHPIRGILMCNLATLSELEGKVQEAEGLYRKALAFLSRTAPADSPYFVSVKEKFASFRSKYPR